MPKSDIKKFCIARTGGFIGACNSLLKCLNEMREAQELSAKHADDEAPPHAKIVEFDQLADCFLAALQAVRPSDPSQTAPAKRTITAESEDRKIYIDYLRQKNQQLFTGSAGESGTL